MNRLTFLFFETLFSIKNYLDYRISFFFDSIYDSYFFSDDIMENKGTTKKIMKGYLTTLTRCNKNRSRSNTNRLVVNVFF